jgi:hypothetical protein
MYGRLCILRHLSTVVQLFDLDLYVYAYFNFCIAVCVFSSNVTCYR